MIYNRHQQLRVQLEIPNNEMNGSASEEDYYNLNCLGDQENDITTSFSPLLL